MIKLKYTWRLGTALAAGGFGRVYAAQAEDGSEAVVKLVPKAPGAARELLFEPVLASRTSSRSSTPESGGTTTSW